MESLSAFLRRHEPDDDKRLAVLKKLAPRIWLVMAFDTTSDGLLTSNDASGEWFDADSATPPENPLRLHVIRQSDGNASDSPYSLLVQVIAHCRKVANGLCKPDWDGTLHHAYISNEDFVLEWEQCLAGATESKPVLAADESSWHTKAREIAVLGVTKSEILSVDWPMPTGAPRLADILDRIPKWVEPACQRVGRVGKGREGSHLWNPAMLCVCLATVTPHKRWICVTSALTKFLGSGPFSEYLSDWEAKAEML